MKKTIDQMSRFLEYHNISLPKGTQKVDSGDNTGDHERCRALKVVLLKSHAFLMDLGASNHMVSSKESLSSLNLSNGSIIHMRDDTQIQDEGKGTIKLGHGVFKNVLYVPSLVINILYVYHMIIHDHQSELYLILT